MILQAALSGTFAEELSLPGGFTRVCGVRQAQSSPVRLPQAVRVSVVAVVHRGWTITKITFASWVHRKSSASGSE